ncbi:LysR family transcriptional regulator [Acidaminococcus massiliensis]|uniref:LysR family transcriptional regulator n=1 Tax=Acidaminococcus massiliensis TaxID=1852375 RepID=UPI0026DA9EC2|nr:LysR family transcriptional regulator [Acidaminococcus massiliensis]
MTLLQLYYFEALARILHFTKAAQELHISQPSLSYAMNELEKELGVKLFIREKKHIELTAYGQQFLPYVKKSLQSLQDGKNILQEMKGEISQSVRIGFFHSISSSFIPPLMEKFYQSRNNRDIHFQFEEGSSYHIYSQIKEQKLDLGFCSHQGPDIKSCLVMRQPLYLIVPLEHPLAKQNYVSFEDFAREQMICLTKGSNLRDRIDEVFTNHHIIPRIVCEVQECNAALRYVELNFGVVILPEVPALRTARVVTLPITDKNKEFIRDINLIWNSYKILSPAATKVKNFIIKNYGILN